MTSANKGNKTEKLRFEEALEQLEKIVESMEEGTVPLQDLIEKFEEGDKLVKYCEKTLKQAELKIEKLKASKGEEQEQPGRRKPYPETELFDIPGEE